VYLPCTPVQFAEKQPVAGGELAACQRRAARRDRSTYRVIRTGLRWHGA